MSSRGSAWVFHAGALGDSVLIWPLLRAMARGGWTVTLVSAGEKARLASRWVGEAIQAIDSETRWVGELFGERPPSAQVHRADVIVSLLCDGEGGEWERRWRANARAALGATEVICAGPPGSESRNALWQRFDVRRLGAVSPRENVAGRIIAHVGAGASSKRWEISRWATCVQRLRATGASVNVIGGEVEAERLNAAERTEFASMGGVVVEGLQTLAQALIGARLFIGCDTGPTHLAAQLGVPTLALFGPTDPAVWGPVGPGVRTLAPAAACGMEWLGVDAVVEAALSVPPPQNR